MSEFKTGNRLIRQRLKTELDDVIVARKNFKESRKSFKEIKVDVSSIENRSIMYNNINVPVRIYTPEGEGPFPIVMYYHGGGFVLGDLDTVDNLCRYISKFSERIVISVGYRLAPEHPYPAALEDAWTSLDWAYNNANIFNGTNLGMAVAGDSAGGNLAALLAIKARDSNVEIESQWLFYPWLDFSHNSNSHQCHGKDYNLTTEQLDWFVSAYLPSNSDRNSPAVSPLKQSDLISLPDTVILTAQYDPLQDDGKFYAKVLEEAGNNVDYSCCLGMTHSFLTKTGEIEAARVALDEVVEKMRRRNKVK